MEEALSDSKPTQSEKLDSVLETLGTLAGAVGNLAERVQTIEASEPSGVTVEAAPVVVTAKPKAAPKPTATTDEPKPNAFTPAAVLRAGMLPAEVGDVRPYTNQKGEAKNWRIVGIGPCQTETLYPNRKGELVPVIAETGGVLAVRA